MLYIILVIIIGYVNSQCTSNPSVITSLTILETSINYATLTWDIPDMYSCTLVNYQVQYVRTGIAWITKNVTSNILNITDIASSQLWQVRVRTLSSYNNTYTNFSQ